MKQSMGAGTVYLMASEVPLLLVNYIIHIALARYLGVEAYGIFGVLMSLYLINRAFFGNGLPKAVSKLISGSKGDISRLYASSLKVQWYLTLCFALIYIVFAKGFAVLLHDPSLTYYIMLMGIISIPLSMVSLYSSGFLNGLRMYKEQAIVKTIIPLTRLILVVLFLLLGFKLAGVLTGYLLSYIITFFICLWYMSRIKPSTPTSDILAGEKYNRQFITKKILFFALPLTFASLGYTLLRNVSTLFIKYFLNDNAAVGLYTAASTLSNVPFMIFVPVSFTLLSSISTAAASGNTTLVRKYISQSLRYMLLLLLPLTALLAATSQELLTFLYSETYASGASVLSLLLVSSVLLAIFSALASVITGVGKPKFEMISGILFMIVLLGLSILLIPSLGLIGAAIAFLITSFIALAVAGIYVYKLFNTLMSLRSFIVISLCSGITFIFAWLWHYSGILLLVNYAVLAGLYFLLLYLFGEIKEEDVVFVKKLIKLGR